MAQAQAEQAREEIPEAQAVTAMATTAPFTMPIYLLGSLQYFADVRAANGIINSASSVLVDEGSGTPGVKQAPQPAPGVSAAAGEGA